MRNLILSVIASFLVQNSSAQAATKWISAGADSSGGGKAVVCRENLVGRILSIEMLDVYEARAMYALEPEGMERTLDENLEAVKAKLLYATSSGESITAGISRLRQKLRILPPGTRIEPVDDASPIGLPKGCQLEQAAVWVDRGLVVADHEHWEAMDARNRAALITHEVVYDFTRRFGGEKNSRRARKITAHAFSSYEFGHYEQGVPNGAPYCFTVGNNTKVATSFRMYANDKGNLVARLSEFEGRILFGKNSATFPFLKYPAEGDHATWDNSEIESTFETESSIALKWDPASPQGERYSLITVDDRGVRIEVPVGCITFGPIEDDKH